MKYIKTISMFLFVFTETSENRKKSLFLLLIHIKSTIYSASLFKSNNWTVIGRILDWFGRHLVKIDGSPGASTEFCIVMKILNVFFQRNGQK